MDTSCDFVAEKVSTISSLNTSDNGTERGQNIRFSPTVTPMPKVNIQSFDRTTKSCPIVEDSIDQQIPVDEAIDQQE